MRLTFDARARAILRRIPAVNVYSALELLLLALLAIQGARLLWAVVTPVAPLGAWRPAGPVVPADPAGVLRDFDPFYRVSGAQTGPSIVTPLQLKLFGIRMNEATGRGSAILAGPDGMQKSISVGEEIIPGAILKSVAYDHVTIDRGGSPEDLFLDQSSSPGGASATPVVVPGASLVGSPASAPPVSPAPQAVTVDQLRADTGMVPRIEGGRINGLTVRSQGAGTAFRAAGLQNGDTVTAIGGRPISGPADMDRVAGDLAKGGTLAITVERNGQTVPLTLQVAPK